MATLGSVLPPQPSGPRGPDLRVEVEVPRAALGLDEGVVVELPDRLEADDGQLHARTASPHDEPEGIRIRLPEDFPDGGVLRLRGQGAGGETAPGDLWLRICLTDARLEAFGSPSSRPRWRWIVLLVLVAGATAGAALLAI